MFECTVTPVTDDSYSQGYLSNTPLDFRVHIDM